MIICMYEGTMRRVFDSSGDAIVNAALPYAVRFRFAACDILGGNYSPESLSLSTNCARSGRDGSRLITTLESLASHGSLDPTQARDATRLSQMLMLAYLCSRSPSLEHS